MAHVTFSAAATRQHGELLEDLILIAGPKIARRYQAGFERIYDELSEYPDMGAPRPRLGKLLRLRVIEPYNVFYRYDPGADIVLILGIIHGRRKVTRRMLRP